MSGTWVRVTDDVGTDYLINPYQLTHMKLARTPGSGGAPAETFSLILGSSPAMVHLKFRSAGARDKAIQKLIGEMPA